MKNKKLSGHPINTSSEALKRICKPLHDALKIDYFSHVNVDRKKNFTGIGTRPDFIGHYLSSGYYNAGVHMRDSDRDEEFVIHDAVRHIGPTQEIFKDMYDHRINHLFTVLQRDGDSIDAFHFGCSQIDASINEAYLSNIPYLKNFIHHFKDIAYQDKALKKAYEIHFKINNHSPGY